MKINKNNISKEFIELKPKYDRLGINVQQALETFLKEKEIPFLSIQFRIKQLDSFLEKIERKGYQNPFTEIEDICAIRIICYYQSDITRIQDIITTEFEIKENQNKEELLEVTEFGYRSTHFIAQIKSDWSSAPNYRSLSELKFEVQVRTILMHSWAEIEHKLSYKSENHIPKELRRKFSRISAKLEEADEQFEEIKNSIQLNKKLLLEQANRDKRFNYNTELNLDSLQAFLDFAFPAREKDIQATSEVLNEMIEYEITFEDIIKGYEIHKENIQKIENETIERHNWGLEDGTLFIQVGALRTLFELINDKYFEDRSDLLDKDILEKFRIANN